MEFNFEKSFQIFLMPMKLMRTHPKIDKNFKWFIQYCFFHLPFTIHYIIITYNSYLNAKNNNFSAACKNGIISLTFLGIWLNNMIMLWHKDAMNRLLDLMAEDYKMAAKLSKEEQEIFKRYDLKKTLVCKVWLVVYIISFLLFCVKAIVMMVYYLLIGEPRLVHLYDLVYPDVIERRKGEFFMFILITVFIFSYGIYAGLVYMSFLPCGPVFMLHACGHLEMVKRRTETLFLGDEEDINERLREIVLILQYTYKFVGIVNDCFKVFYEATLKLSAVSLPVTFYSLLEGLQRGLLSLEFASFILSGMALSSAPCYFSDMLMAKGEEVRLALYSCGWECEYNRRVRITILLLLTRCSRPIAVQTMFTTLCLDRLTDMFQQAYTIFNLMNAVWS
uniref:Odorant receptor n=1 Tax=Spodoptera frugiperda TaxID=7108 RepID=A0A2H1W8S1_SPOFR